MVVANTTAIKRAVPLQDGAGSQGTAPQHKEPVMAAQPGLGWLVRPEVTNRTIISHLRGLP